MLLPGHTCTFRGVQLILPYYVPQDVTDNVANFPTPPAHPFFLWLSSWIMSNYLPVLKGWVSDDKGL